MPRLGSLRVTTWKHAGLGGCVPAFGRAEEDFLFRFRGYSLRSPRAEGPWAGGRSSTRYLRQRFDCPHSCFSPAPRAPISAASALMGRQGTQQPAAGDGSPRYGEKTIRVPFRDGTFMFLTSRLCRPSGTPDVFVSVPGTAVPGYRLFRRCATGSHELRT